MRAGTRGAGVVRVCVCGGRGGGKATLRARSANAEHDVYVTCAFGLVADAPTAAGKVITASAVRPTDVRHAPLKPSGKWYPVAADDVHEKPVHFLIVRVPELQVGPPALWVEGDADFIPQRVATRPQPRANAVANSLLCVCEGTAGVKLLEDDLAPLWQFAQ